MTRIVPPGTCGVLVLRVQDEDGRFRATATWTHDIESWPGSVSRRDLSLDQVTDTIREFLTPYEQRAK